MKKIFLFILSIISIIILLAEPEAITLKIIFLKGISLLYFYIIVKVNNYFYQGE